MRSSIFSPHNLEADTTELWVTQNAHMVRARLTAGRSIIAWKGSMVAYQGDIDFDHKSSGSIGMFFKRMMTSDNLPLMRVAGQGEVFLAAQAANVHLIHLDGESITVNGSSLLAFDETLEYDLSLVKGAGIVSSGLWNTTLTGYGTAVIATVGQPIVLDCTQQPTFTDVDATVAWAGSIQPGIQRTAKLKSIVGRGSGEAAQYAFHGPGFVIVQPYEGGTAGAGGGSGSGGGGSNFGLDLFN